MITVVDYGMGNMASVAKACALLGFPCRVTASPEEVFAAEKLILPGVGAFGQAMQNLNESGLAVALVAAVQKGTPLLGICLGMQLLFQESREHGTHKGLSLLPGTVSRFPAGQKIPHMGWNSLNVQKPDLFAGTQNPNVYFVHSFYAPLGGFTAARCHYGIDFSAAVQEGHVFGTQFHPEKSGEEGLRILKNYLVWQG